MKKLFFGLAVVALVTSYGAQAAPQLSGVVFGPDGGFSIDFSFRNDSTAGETITSLSMNGGTATAFPILWDEPGTLGGQTANVSGVDTQLVTFNLTSSWDPTELFTLTSVDPDGDPGPVSVMVGDLIGTTITATFSSGFVGHYVFVDDPSNGLILRVAAIPEPGTLALLGLSVAGLAYLRRRKLN